ncbi:MAG: CBS domain-containing protein [Spirochaetes bacterium]|nr:CBS domain-containing protein [Spirochaetota bacterium]
MPEIQLSKVDAKDVCRLIVKDASTVKANSSIDDILKKMIENLNTRHVYVVDNNSKLLGSIKFSNLIIHMFPFSSIGHKIELNREGLINYKKSLIAMDLMNTKPTFAKENDKLPYIIQLMNEKNIGELPIINSSNQVIGEINFMEIITYYLGQEKK